MSYATIIRNLPEDLRFTMLELAEAVEQNMRAELAVRREDITVLQGVVREVSEMQYRADQRLDRLETALVDLAEAQARTEQRVEELAEAQKRTEETLRALIVRMDHTDIKVNSLLGDNLERKYRERAHGYFGRILRRVRAVSFQEIEPLLDERLPAAMVDDLRLLDLIVQGRHKERAELSDLWLAVEISIRVDRNDVKRAQRRAAALRQAGYLAVAAVAGEQQTEGAEDEARANGVVILQNGTVQYWDEALRMALG